LTTLYKKDSKGKIRQWKIYTNAEMIWQESGLVGGAQVTNSKRATPKNVGKSNATTGAEQAISEMNSSIEEQLKTGYFRTIEEAENSFVVLPMLAKDFKKEEKKIDWEQAFTQPKFDGMRCLSTIDDGYVEQLSRDGKEITTMSHIADALASIDYEGKLIIDGELYAHGLNFQENMRLIKKWREGEEGSIMVNYHVYDIVSDEPFDKRIEQVYKLLKDLPFIRLVPTTRIYNKAQLNEQHSKYLALGYEGTMVRWGKEGYRLDARSSHLLKYKDFQDLALTIVDIESATQRPEWGVPVFEIEGKKFRAGMKFSHEERKEFLINKDNYIGKTAELRFFEYSEDGIPRFPVCVGFRLDK
jgi:ATP-dependent DNA ligase